MRLIKKASDFLASYKLSCALFLLLLLLTYLGTMNQVENGLYQSQQKYFESLFVVHWAFGAVPVPLPGGYLVMALTFANLLWGVVVRFRARWSKAGITLAHAGILVMLAGAYVSYAHSINGHMILYENEQSDEFESSYEWEIGVAGKVSDGKATEYIIRQGDFEDLAGDRQRVFKFAGLPFDLKIWGYAPNAVLDGGEAGGGVLKERPLDREHEQNMAGANVAVIEKTDGTERRSVVWAGAAKATVLEAGGAEWSLSLRKRRFELPFAVRLDKFTRELHPRTNMPREFTSDITSIEGGVSRQVKITMNEPFRHLGYTFYQSSWGPQNSMQNGPFYSVFAVVKNPADQVPLYACVITTIGLVLHFLQKLLTYLKKERARTP